MCARYCMFLAIALPVGGDSSAKDGKKDKKDRLDGEWTLSSMELRGKVMGEKQRNDWKLVVKADEWLQSSKADPSKGMKMTFEIDPSKSPKQIDFKWDGGIKTWTLKGIYKLDGETLTVCKRNEDGEERPKGFKAGDSTVLAVYKRAKKK